MDGVQAAQAQVVESSTDLSAGVDFLSSIKNDSTLTGSVPSDLLATSDDTAATIADRASRSVDERASLEGDVQDYAVDGNPDYKQSEQGVQLGAGAIGLPVDEPVHVTSPYGIRVYPLNRSLVVLHPGIDLAGTCGSPEYSAAAGTVTKAEANGTHGNQMIIDNGEIRGEAVSTVYNHMSSFVVKPGDEVAKGQLVGYIGATGNVTGCHLHFEVWVNNLTVDPAKVFPAGFAQD